MLFLYRFCVTHAFCLSFGPPPRHSATLHSAQPPPKTVRKNSSFLIHAEDNVFLCQFRSGRRASCREKKRQSVKEIAAGERCWRATVSAQWQVPSSAAVRAKPKEIAPPCFSGLALMHVPVSRQQETPPAFTD